MKRLTRYEIYAVKDDVYLENGEVWITNPDIKVCLACDVGDLENKTEEIIRRQKYKRCLAMAKRCLWKKLYLRDSIPAYSNQIKWENRAYKWEKRWLELAEKFKD